MSKECCSAGEKEAEVNQAVNPAHHHSVVSNSGLRKHWDLIAALTILLSLLACEHIFGIQPPAFLYLLLNVIAYLLAGWNVLKLAFRKLSRGDIFNEFVLMSVATLGAFYIGEYSEGVAVMVFYAIGEWFQDAAVDRAKTNIKALLDMRPNEVCVLRGGSPEISDPAAVVLNETIRVKPGEKVALDGILLSDNGSFNASALTGESKPDRKYQGDQVLAGMINLNTVSDIKVTALFKDSKLSQILAMVQDATARKSQTQLFISRFAKVYTPIVFFLALALTLLPYFFVNEYVFNEWLYRALVFLVVSCPCALVVSIPLGYFGGIGLASKNGILFKGGNFLDVLTKINVVVMDKTGTLTRGVFNVQKVITEQIDKNELLGFAVALEKNSSHPIARAIISYADELANKYTATDITEIGGLGLTGMVNGRQIMAGNSKLMNKYGIEYPGYLDEEAYTNVIIAVDHKYAGSIIIADELKPEAKNAVQLMHNLSITTVMLSGDKQAVVNQVAETLGIDQAYGDLLPEGKVKEMEKLKQKGKYIAFAGDGVNDAPVIALADAGIAMGGLGSDVAIETADIVIQNDQVSKIVSAIKIGHITRNIVWQNIGMAMGVKLLVLMMGAFGLANLWEAVIADVGVALLAILNAVRIQQKNV
jgi:Cd2+/Zn2+-exporting ATPase